MNTFCVCPNPACGWLTPHSVRWCPRCGLELTRRQMSSEEYLAARKKAYPALLNWVSEAAFSPHTGERLNREGE
jgi:hypothetical protein